MVGPLVEIEPGFLPTGDIGKVAGTVHGHLDRPGDRIAHDLEPFAKALQPPNPRRRVDHHRAATRHRLYRSNQIILQAIRPGGIRLDHGAIAKAVDDHARQPVALGMGQAVECALVETFAQRQRRPQARLQPGLINACIRVVIQQPRRDLAVRVEPGNAQRSLAFGQTHDAAGCQRPGSPIHGNLVGKGPGRAPGQSSPFARTQLYNRVVGHTVSYSLRRQRKRAGPDRTRPKSAARGEGGRGKGSLWSRR